MNLLERVFDERFLAHRQRSTSIAARAAACVAAGLFLYHGMVTHVWNWDLAAVLLAMVVVKLAVMIWSLRNL